MTNIIEQLLRDALMVLHSRGFLAHRLDMRIEVRRSQCKNNGYFYTNVALALSKNVHKKAYDIAIAIVDALPTHPFMSAPAVTTIGLIYFYMTPVYRVNLLNKPLHYLPSHDVKQSMFIADNDKHTIQYAQARTVSLFEQLRAQSFLFEKTLGASHVDKLTHPYEEDLFFLLSHVIECDKCMGTLGELRQLTYDLRSVANVLHSYYNAVPILCEREALRTARLLLLIGVERILRYGMALLGMPVLERG